MQKEALYFLCGVLVVAVPLVLLYMAKKFDLFESKADDRLTYRQVDGRALSLHAFRAQGGKVPAPAIVLFHGGGWRFGSPGQFFPQCRYFASRGFNCFSAEYRLGPVHAPDIAGAIDDAGAALDYLRQHSGELGIDAHRIYAGGGSSGGHLAAALGAGMHGAKRARPAALVLYNPVLDLSPCTAAHFLAGDNWRQVSPLQQVDAAHPPVLIMSGSEDREVPPSMVESYCGAVREAGGHCETEIYADQYHGFFNDFEGNPYFEETNTRVLGFLGSLRD